MKNNRLFLGVSLRVNLFNGKQKGLILGKLTANCILNTDLDLFSLVCTLLEENLSGLR